MAELYRYMRNTNAFEFCQTIENESYKLLEPMILDLWGVCEPITDLAMQLTHGDLKSPKGSYIEIKAEKKHTGNLFIERWSNEGKKLGWAWKIGHRNGILYTFLDKKVCYIIPANRFKAFIDEYDWKNNPEGFRYVRQNKYEQMNVACGYLVPINRLLELGIIFKEIDLTNYNNNKGD